MLTKLIQYALTQRLMTLLVALLLIGFGGRALIELPIDAFPDISPTQVKLIIKAPGMTPEEVEALITQPVEVELLGIPRKNYPAFDFQIRSQFDHHGFRRGNRHLLGTAAGCRNGSIVSGMTYLVISAVDWHR